MTKFSISASRSQAQAAAKACSNLKSDVNQLMNKVNSFGAENFEGAAADNAQRYAETVIMPLLRGASALFDDIPIAMKRLPGEYEGKVDHKSWSTEKLKAKIKQYEAAAKKAQKAADAANKLAQKASGMGTVGAGIMAAASKCAAGFEKGMASAQKAIAKFKKILDDFDRFDIFSPTIFNEIATLESNLNKGQKVANGAYNPSSHQFSIPKENELDWAKELNGTYAEHISISKKSKEIWDSFRDTKEKKFRTQYNLHGLKNKKFHIDHIFFTGKMGMKQGIVIKGIIRKGESSFKEDGRAFKFFLKGHSFFNSPASAKATFLKTKAHLWGGLTPKELGFNISAGAGIADMKAQIYKDIGIIRGQIQGNIKYFNADAHARCTVSDDGSFDVGTGGDATFAEADVSGSVGVRNNSISFKKGDKDVHTGLQATFGVNAGINGNVEVASQKVRNLKSNWNVYNDKLDIDLGALLKGGISIEVPSVRYFNKNEPLKTLITNLILGV